MLDDLYWVMSYSRWQDERYWPAFRDALLQAASEPDRQALLKAREFNVQRYHFQGIGRYAPDAAFARGLADLQVLANLMPATGYVHGRQPTSIDAGIYGFIANIYFYDIDTPLKQFVVAHDNIVRHCRAIHAMVSRAAVTSSIASYPGCIAAAARKARQQHGEDAGEENAVKSSGAADRGDRRAEAATLSRLVRSAPISVPRLPAI